MSSKILASFLFAGLMAASVCTPGVARANPGDTETVCVPFEVYHGVYHQECTVYIYAPDGSVIYTAIYYIDEYGQWYIR